MKTQKHQKTDAPSTHKPNDKKYTLVNWIAFGIFFSFLLLMTIGQNPDFFWKLQDLDLFVYTRTFFLDSIFRVGGLSMYVGSFLYQFFYFPMAGAFLLLFFLLLITLLTAKTFELKKWLFPLSFIPSLAIILSLNELGYLIYFQKIDGYVFNTIIGVSFILTGLIYFQKIGKLPVKIIYASAYLLIGYPICGAYALFGGFLMLLVLCKDILKDKSWASISPILALVASLTLIPYLYYRFLFKQLAYSDIYTANLPHFAFQGAEMKLWVPFLLLAIFFICLVLWKRDATMDKQRAFARFLPVLLFIACLAIVYAFTYKDKNFNTELSMQRASDKEDWNDVLKLARNQKDEPTRLIVMNTNLALFKLGLAGDNMFQYKNGNKEMNSTRFIVPVQIAGTMFYYQYGILNFCHKWCMEGMVEYGLSVSVLKYFVLCNLLNGDIALAQKYNDVLKSTLFYKSWALKHQRYIDDPKTIPEAVEFNKIVPLTTYEDDLTLDFDHLEQFLRIHFSEMREVPKELTELSVLFNLDLKNNVRFWPRLFRWIHLNPSKRIPTHFQEAAILYGSIERMDLSGAPFDDAVKANYAQFQDMVKQYSGYGEETMKSVFSNPFGNTFWYYYFFVKDPQSKKKDEKGYQN